MNYFDPAHTATASQDMVLIGHSMGGVIARLMVSSSGDAIERMARIDHDLDDEEFARMMTSLSPVVSFEPVPNVGRAIFVAAPHHGTDVAAGWLRRWLASFVRLPGDLTQGIAQQLQASRRDRAPRSKDLANSVQNLDKNDPFIKAAADLPISPCVQYHSIIARRAASVPLALSDDGICPSAAWETSPPVVGCGVRARLPILRAALRRPRLVSHGAELHQQFAQMGAAFGRTKRGFERLAPAARYAGADQALQRRNALFAFGERDGWQRRGD
nr:GPI inositol-deacylase [Cupriavidus pinatubonensis]